MREFEDRARASSFGADAEQYDRTRPGYPARLVDDLMADGPHDVLDIGCGTAKLGRLFAERGCTVVGLEPDARMADVGRRYLPVVEAGSFETWDAAGRTFDLAVAGQAWHWVDPAAGARRLVDVVRPGGRVALVWNLGHHEAAIRPALDAVYERLAPHQVTSSLGQVRNDETEYVAPIDATRAFEPVDVRAYRWHWRYTRDEWLDQLPTHSNHRLLHDDDRSRLLDAVGDVIDDFGGSFVMDYVTVLLTTRRS